MHPGRFRKQTNDDHGLGGNSQQGQQGPRDRTVVTLGEVAVVRGDNGVLGVLGDVRAVPLADAGAAGVGQHSGTGTHQGLRAQAVAPTKHARARAGASLTNHSTITHDCHPSLSQPRRPTSQSDLEKKVSLSPTPTDVCPMLSADTEWCAWVGANGAECVWYWYQTSGCTQSWLGPPCPVPAGIRVGIVRDVRTGAPHHAPR